LNIRPSKQHHGKNLNAKLKDPRFQRDCTAESAINAEGCCEKTDTAVVEKAVLPTRSNVKKKGTSLKKAVTEPAETIKAEKATKVQTKKDTARIPAASSQTGAKAALKKSIANKPETKIKAPASKSTAAGKRKTSGTANTTAKKKPSATKTQKASTGRTSKSSK